MPEFNNEVQHLSPWVSVLGCDRGRQLSYIDAPMSSRKNETEMGGSGRSFQKTLWTQVLKAKDPRAADRRMALEQLIQNYWKPVYFYIRKRGNSVDAAKDLAQGFFSEFLERDFLQYVQRDRGKFRTFLLTALDHYMTDEYRRAAAQKRGGGEKLLSLDYDNAETEFSKLQTNDVAADRLFLRRWALRVTGQALQALRGEFESNGKIAEFEILKGHFALAGGKAFSYDEIAEKLGVTQGAVKSKIHRLRKQYRGAIYGEIRAYTNTKAEAEEELRDLFQAFLHET